MILITTMPDLGSERLEVAASELSIGVLLSERVYSEAGIVNQLLDMVGVSPYGRVRSFDLTDESFERDQTTHADGCASVGFCTKQPLCKSSSQQLWAWITECGC